MSYSKGRWPHRIVFEYIPKILLESRRIEDALRERECVRGQDLAPVRGACTGQSINQTLLFLRWRAAVTPSTNNNSLSSSFKSIHHYDSNYQASVVNRDVQ